MIAPEQMDLLGPIARFRLPPDTCKAIEHAAEQAQREQGPRGRAERERVKRFLAALHLTVGLKLHGWGSGATRADLLEPLKDIAKALDTIERSVRALDRLPGNHAVALDLHLRLACVAREIPGDVARAIADQALNGGCIDLPSAGPDAFGLRWFLLTLRAAVEHGIGEAPAPRRGRPEGSSPVTPLVHGIADAYAGELHCPPLIDGSPAPPFLSILRAIFDALWAPEGIECFDALCPGKETIAGRGRARPFVDKTLIESAREWAPSPFGLGYLPPPAE
jgi:hypothetical protein